MFCFGERDSRSKTLLTLINEHALNSDQNCGGASVTVEFKVHDHLANQTLVKVKRSIVLSHGKTRSEYHYQYQDSFSLVSRELLIEKLAMLGINLEVVDSFICKQQGSTVTQPLLFRLFLFNVPLPCLS